MSVPDVLKLMQAEDDRTKFESGYYQAQVTSIDATTGQVYLQQIDDEDNLPDDAPYTYIKGFEPEVGEWVWVARSGRTGVVLGALTRDIAPDHFKLPNGTYIVWGAGDPNGVYTYPFGSVYYRSDGVITTRSSGVYIKTTDGTTAYGWMNPADATRMQVTRQVLVYQGASTTSSFRTLGFPEDPTIQAASATNQDSSTGPFLGLNTSSVSGNVAYVKAGANSATQMRWTPRTRIKVQTGNPITSARYWWGLFSATPEASDDPAISAIGVRLSSSASDSSLKLYTNDGTGGGTITDTGIAANTSTTYEITMDITDTYVDFYISGVWKARHTTNLPATTDNLFYGLYCTTLSAAARMLRWNGITMQSE